jgi:hydroxymethylpyrimidine/phosphomethylpyrimidine kinase
LIPGNSLKVLVCIAAKTGMLLNQGIIEAVSEQAPNIPNLVVDPVMVSRTGAQLIDDAAIAALKTLLVPHALILTPNRYEAQLLSGIEITTLEDMRNAAQQIFALGAKSVLVKGGGMRDELRGVDVWFDGTRCETFAGQRVETKHTHGTGCTLAAAITANLALGKDLRSAIEAAKQYVTTALEYALAIGQGQGPVGHFFPLLRG